MRHKKVCAKKVRHKVQICQHKDDDAIWMAIPTFPKPQWIHVSWYKDKFYINGIEQKNNKWEHLDPDPSVHD